MHRIKSGKPRKCQFQHIVKEIHRRISDMKVCSRLLFDIAVFIKIFCQHHGIVQIDIWHDRIIDICHIRLQCQHIYRLSILKKIFLINLIRQKHIIVKIDKLFCQIRNPMQIPFDRMRIKGRPILPRNKVLMIYDTKLWMIRIQPLWQMPPGHKVDLSHPRGILFHAAEPVLQIVPVPISFFSVVYICHDAKVLPCFLFFFLPPVITSIHPGDDKINFLFSFFCRTHFYSLIQVSVCLI